MTYIIVDSLNTFARARHGVQGGIDIKVGLSLHILFSSIKRAWQDFGGKHVVFCLEGRSWRKDFYEPYKRNRVILREAMTTTEVEEDKLFFEAFSDFANFVNEKTNCTILQHPQLEADDLIAGFVQNHPNDNHVIISSDSDYVQLISDNVKIYDGIKEHLLTKDGIYDTKKRKLSFIVKSDSKLKVGKVDENFQPPEDWHEFALFLKCIRGDTGDNVFSAYPGARIKSSKKTTGLQEAFNDRKKKGYAWNNIMLQRWVDHCACEHKVLDDYDRNRRLIDLSYQPDDIRKIIDQTVLENSKPKNISQVGIRMMKFCQSYELNRIIENIQHYAEPFQARYPDD